MLGVQTQRVRQVTIQILKTGNYVSLHNGTRLEYHAMDNTPTQVGDFETKTLVVNNYDVVTTMGRDETIH